MRATTAARPQRITLRQLCSKDKHRVRQLIQELASSGVEREKLEERLGEERGRFRELLASAAQQCRELTWERNHILLPSHAVPFRRCTWGIPFRRCTWGIPFRRCAWGIPFQRCTWGILSRCRVIGIAVLCGTHAGMDLGILQRDSACAANVLGEMPPTCWGSLLG